MVKAIFHRQFDATDTTRGVSRRIYALPEPQTLPRWMIALAVKAGAATPVPSPAAAGRNKETRHG